MFIYLGVLCLSVFPIWYSENNFKDTNKQKNYILYSVIFSALLLILVGSLRSLSVGYDLRSYHEYFVSDYYYNIEKGYVSLSRIVAYLNLDFRVLLILVQSIVIIPIYYVLYKTSKMKWLSVLGYQSLYLYVNSFNILRQSLAMSIFLLATYFLITMKDNVKSSVTYVGLTILASLFHVSALLLIPLFFLKFLNLNKWYILGLTGISLVLFLGHNQLLSFLMSLFSREYYGEFTIEIGYATIAIFAAYIGLFLILKQKLPDLYLKNKFLSNILVLALLFNVLWVWFPNHARISMYFYMVVAIYFPTLLYEYYEVTNKRCQIVTYTVCLVGFYALQLMTRDYGGVVPYTILINILMGVFL